MDNDPNHTAKATKEFKANKRIIQQWPSQSPDLNQKEHAFHLLKIKLSPERPMNNQQLTTAADRKGLGKHYKGGKAKFGDILWFQTLGSLCLQRILDKALKITIVFMIM